MAKIQLPKMLKKLHLNLLLLCSLIGFGSYAQTYPIAVNTQITQPSPIYLRSYADATTINSPIKIQLVLNDLTISNRQVKLKIYFQGNTVSFTTNDFVVGARPLYLEGGFPLQLTNVDLAPYFEYQNLSGVTPNQFAYPLAEGVYNIYVEVYDFATGKKLSKKTGSTTIIFHNKPPFLNLPSNNASIMQQNIQNIIFSWTPGSSNVSNVEYEFSLVEIWDQYTPVQNAFAYSPPLYTTTTRNTTLQYGINEPQLIPGKKYAWRIKAKAILGAEEIGVFLNNGYSEIYSFTYEVFCTSPLAIKTDGISQDQAKISWSGNIDNYDYQVNYREKNADSEWYKLVTPRESLTISNLKPTTVYEYTVGASCDVGKYTHSSVKEFTTLAKDEITFQGCGIKPDPNDLANKTPLPELFPNDVVTAGDFPIVVLHSTGSNGTFTGDGYVTLPFLEKFRKLIDAADALGGEKINIGQFSRIRITFKNIGVNTDFKLISGEIVASYDPDWKNIANLDGVFNDVFGSNGKPIEGKFDYEVVSVKLNSDGSTTVTGAGGQTSIIPKSPYERVYTDSKGKVVTIPANGAGAPNITTAAEGGKATAANTNGMSAAGEVTQISSADVKITFKNGDDSKYAFDVKPNFGSQKLKDTYEVIPMKDGGIYNVNYKAVSDIYNSKDFPETIIAKAEFKNGKTKDNIVFKTNAGAKVNFKWDNDDTAIITVEKTLNFSKESIIATVKGVAEKDPKDAAKTIEGKSDVAGKINLWQLAQKPVINITLLSINGADSPSTDEAKKFLNDVYNKVGISFDVTFQSLSIGTLPNEIECGDSDVFNVYTAGQNDIISQIESNAEFRYNDKTYYVLYTGKKGQKEYKGFMPLGGQYAFVFNNGSLKTAAHELGHGIFGLKHPFTNKAEEGKTDLLMDYGDGTVLSHNDWDIIHSGGWKFYGFQKSSSGANVNIYDKIPYTFLNLDKDPKNETKGTVSFVTPDGQIVSIPHSKLMRYEFIYGSIRGNEDSKSYNNKTKTGGLKSFEKLEEDGKTIHKYVYDNSKGYIDEQDQKIYKDLTDFSKVDGFIFPLLNANSNYAIFKLSFPVSEHQNLAQYTAGTTDIALDVFINKIAPYTSKFSNNLSKEISVPNISCLWCYDQNTKNMLKDHFGKPEQLWINKIAEMRVVYPGFFEKFSDTYTEQSGAGATAYASNIVTTYKWDENFRVNLSDHTGWRGQSSTYNFVYELYNNADKQKYYEKYFQYFDTSLNEQVKANNECLKSLFDPNIALGKDITKEQIECLKLATELEFQNLESERAISLIKMLMQRNLWDGEEEKIVVNILAYTKFDSNILIDLLENDKVVFSWPNTRGGSGPATIKKEFPLWYIMYLKINDSNWVVSGDNRKLLMSVFYQHFLRSEKYTNGINNIIDNYKLKSIKELTEYLKKPEVATTYDYKNIFVRGYADFASYLSNSTTLGLFYDYSGKDHKFLSIDAKYDEQTKKIYVEQLLKEGLFKSESMGTTKYSPFDFMLFKNLSKDNLLIDYKANKDKDGKPIAIPVPAILSLYSSEVGDSQTQADIIQTSFDALSFAIPGGQLTKLGKVIFYADKISSVTSMAGTAFRETNPELAGFFNKASLVTGIVSVGDLVLSNNMVKITNKFESIKENQKISDIIRDVDPQLNYTAIEIKTQTLDFAQEVLTIEKDKRITLLSKSTKDVSVIQLEKNLAALKDAKAIDALEMDLVNKAIKLLNSDKAIVESSNLVTLLNDSKLITLNKEIKALDETARLKFMEDFAKANLTDLTKIQDEKLLEVWVKYGKTEKLIIDDLAQIKKVWKVKFRENTVDFDAFEKTMQYNSTIVQRAKAYELWGAEKWNDLFDYFHQDPKKLINGGWPPYDGFYKIEKTVSGSQIETDLKTLFFDRFQTKFNGVEQDILGGGFASPINNSIYNQVDNVFTYDARALMDDLEEGTYYFKFRLKNTDGVSFDVGPAIPWKTKAGKEVMGGATQVRLKGMKFGGIEEKIDIIQQSRLDAGKKWTHLVEDTRESVKKIMTKKLDCN